LFGFVVAFGGYFVLGRCLLVFGSLERFVFICCFCEFCLVLISGFDNFLLFVGVACFFIR
jgi:hypothetical protein